MKRKNYVSQCSKCKEMPEYSNDLNFVSGVKGLFCSKCEQVVKKRLLTVQDLILLDDKYDKWRNGRATR
jgi:hypothetical protein